MFHHLVTYGDIIYNILPITLILAIRVPDVSNYPTTIAFMTYFYPSLPFNCTRLRDLFALSLISGLKQGYNNNRTRSWSRIIFLHKFA